jgi:hypothetical protein
VCVGAGRGSTRGTNQQHDDGDGGVTVMGAPTLS